MAEWDAALRVLGMSRVCAAVVLCEDHPPMPFRACIVTFRDHAGVLQTAKVDAETASRRQRWR
jgi:hypothetical protein